MSYQPLARKYRPSTFEDLVGQSSVVLALSNAIKLGREPHGVIFSGVRGVGKTTLARLYAKALNCEKGPTPTPCDQCESCRAISQGIHEDVLEVDGASNTGVDDVRGLRDTLGYVPQRSKFKVYIIDEVHMLSASAFNALLKSLEEPPPHVVFIFATTELNKIPDTIVSRCQTFNLQKFPVHAIAQRLKTVLDREKVPFDERALLRVAREGHGSMRDALTLVDQAIALGEGRVTMDSLSRLVSNVSSTPYLMLLEGMVDRDPQKIMSVLNDLDNSGIIDFAVVVEEVAKQSRNAFVIKDMGAGALNVALLGLDDAEMAKLEEVSAKAAPLDLNRIFRTLVQCRKDLDGSTLDRFVLENYALEWCFDPGFPQLDDLLGDVQTQRPESAAKRAVPAPAQKAAAPASSSVPPDAKSEQQGTDVESTREKIAEKPLEPRTLPADWRGLVDLWKQAKPLQARQLEDVHNIVYSAEKIVVIVNEDSLSGKALLKKEQQQKIQEQFKELFLFNGVFQAIPKSVAAAMLPVRPKPAEQTALNSQADPEAGRQEPVLPETIREIKDAELAKKRAAIIEEAKNNPYTKNVLDVFGGVIDDIRITDSK